MPFSSPYPDLEIPQKNILSYLFPHDEQPFNEPIWFDSRDDKNNLSPKQLLQWVKRLGFGLQRLGLQRGDVAMIYTPNHIFVPVAYLGIVGSGCVFSAANPAFTVPELVHQIKDTTAKIILTHPNILKTALAAAEKAGVPKSRIFQFSDTENPSQEDIPDWRALIGTPAEGATYKWPKLTPSEAQTTVATINYSSGTTGLPKGVCVSHANVIANMEQITYMHYPHRPLRERWIGFTPLYHAYGQLWATMLAARLRVPIYIMSGEFRFEEFLECVVRYRITHLQAVPPILVMLAKRPETARFDLSGLRGVICGAAPLSRELQVECQERFGVRIDQAWGMTEMTCGATIIRHGTVGDTTGSVGRLIPNCECKLIDDDGNEVGMGSGQPGEIYIRGPNVCLGYWRNEQATKETLDKDGWLRTGDVGICDKDGLFWIVDRKKELIKVNGFQVAPAELEGVLLENEHIADAAVVGITMNYQELPRAYVVIHETSKGKVTPKNIQDWIKTRVTKHRYLTGGVVFIDVVPKSPSGKIIRKIMREMAKRDAAKIDEVVQSKL